MIFKNEIEFKAHLIERLRDIGCYVIPIQSRTVRGIPDLYVSHPKYTAWIECKCIKQSYDAFAKLFYTIPFRAGQQALAYQLFKSSGNPVICAVAFKDTVMGFAQETIYIDRKVPVLEFDFLDHWFSNLNI